MGGFTAGETLTVRGEGGDVFEYDVPAEGTTRREIFEEQVRKGWLTVLADPVPERKPELEPEPEAPTEPPAKSPPKRSTG